jgi:hypothetical protein
MYRPVILILVLIVVLTIVSYLIVIRGIAFLIVVLTVVFLILDRRIPYPCLLLVFSFLTIGFLILVWRGPGRNLVRTGLDFA